MLWFDGIERMVVGNIEIRLHGRGGQGAVRAAEMLVAAFAHEGKYAAGFPFFGSERRGAPTTAFVRFGETKIREKTKIYFPDCLLVFDDSQLNLPGTYSGLKEGGTLVVNTPQYLAEKPHLNLKSVGMIHATPIALQELGIPAVSTCMMGAFAATTGWITLDSLLPVLSEYFSGSLLEKNITCMKRGYGETAFLQ
jgi:2-oxoacid:acceptor oxidoreductase gamma subunit (pyruvate/2-ketoisovalerate family)